MSSLRCALMKTEPARDTAPLRVSLENYTPTTLSVRFALDPHSSTLFTHSAGFPYVAEGIAAVQMCNAQYELGEVAELGPGCFVAAGDYITLAPRLLTCYFTHECDDAAEWPQEAFANSSSWNNAFTYGDEGQCRSVTQTTTAHLVTGQTSVQPNATLATTNYSTVLEPPPRSTDTDIIKFVAPIAIVVTVMALAAASGAFGAGGTVSAWWLALCG